MSGQTKQILLFILVLALAGEIFFVARTELRLASNERKVSALETKIASNEKLLEDTKKELVTLKAKTSDIEIAATKELASFKTNLTQAEASRTKLEGALATEQKARQLSELSSKVDSLKASVNLAALKEELTTSISSTDLAEIVDKWRERIVKVECHVGTSLSSGSGVLMSFADVGGGAVGVLTNRHVLLGDSAALRPSSCDVRLPRSGVAATAFTARQEIQISGGEDIDFGRLVLSNPPAEFVNSIKASVTRCVNKPKQGETLLILGYPSIGSVNDITATDGIISGFDGDYYITSAKVEKGNSGGAAILVKDNCMLGIPTFVKKGGLESLARILDIGAIIK